MLDNKSNLRKLLRKVKRTRFLTGAAIAVERIVEKSWRLLSWILFFFGLWLLQIPDNFLPKGQLLSTLIFFAGIFIIIRKDISGLSLPTENEIDRRIESTSALNHRPLAALRDKLANPKKMHSRTLWHSARHHLIEALSKIKPSYPKSLITLRDPHALRFAAALIFILGLSVAGNDYSSRISQGILPFSYNSDGTQKKTTRFIITPPKYTGVPQIILNGSGKKSLDLPAGSLVKVVINGGFVRPIVNIDGIKIPFDDSGSHNYSLETTIPDGNSLHVTQSFLPRGSFKYNLRPDKPPEISMDSDNINLAPRGSINIPFKVTDDYGVTVMSMHMELDLSHDTDKDIRPLGKAITLSRSVLSPAGKTFDITPSFDLTAHPWAGLPVEMSFRGQDYLGQQSNVEILQITLPERKFINSLAQKIITIRKQLIQNPFDHYETLINQLETLQTHPDDFNRDNVVLLALRTAASRLYWSGPSLETAESVVDLLWDAAIKIEEGNLSVAALKLREAQNNLEAALRNPDATNEDLAQLMDNFRHAMGEYLRELQNNLPRLIAEDENPMYLPAKLLTSQTLAEIFDKIESDMMSGNRSAAQQMLSQLENLFSANPVSMNLPDNIVKMMEAANELERIISDQKALLEQTKIEISDIDKTNMIRRDFGKTLPPDTELMDNWGIIEMPPTPHKDSTNEQGSIANSQPLQTKQESIRLSLAALMVIANEAIGKTPDNMLKAENEMQASSQDLWNNNPQQSKNHQQNAIDYLEQSQQKMSEILAEQMKKIKLISFGAGMKMDPLGRPYGDDGHSTESNVQIPDESEKKRAQEILQLLQKRAGELDRPPAELDYYRRLLRRF